MEPEPPTSQDGRTASRKLLTQQALAGVSIVAGRGLVILVVAFGGTVLLARLLTPADFGVIAIGMAIVLVIALVSDGGLGAALIRRPEPPTRTELEALMALQLSITTAVALAVSLVALQLGEQGAVIALMTASTPIVAFQFPGRIVLERELAYRRLAVVEIVQTVTNYAWAVGFALAGWGVWSLASSIVVMRIAGAVAMLAVSPVGIIPPRFRWTPIRALLGFGVQFQAVNATWLVRDLSLSVGVTAIASSATLGLWVLGKRLLEVPMLVFESLLRVSFPTMSRIVASGEESSALVERAAGLSIVAMGVVLTGIAASAPGTVPGLFGDAWSDAAYAVPGACFGLAIGGSAVVATQSYLYAMGNATLPLRANTLQAVVWVVVGLSLLPVLGVAALGLGWAASALVEVFVLARGIRDWTDADVVGPLCLPAVLGVAAASCGWATTVLAGSTLLSGIAGGALASALFAGSLFVLRRDVVGETYTMASRSLRLAFSRNAVQPAE